MTSAYWILEQIDDVKFPYRLSIKQNNKLLISLYVQEKWPGTKGQIFCIREDPAERMPAISLVEKVPIISINRYGKRMAVVLDRSAKKRCDFLFLKKRYRTREGEYEQIFWRTQNALNQRRAKVKLTLQGSDALTIIIDHGERYAWKFPNCDTSVNSLPAGDYALIDSPSSNILAVIERKTFDDLVASLGKLAVFHQKLGELAAYPHSALVIEANYYDFLKPTGQPYYSPSFMAKAIAELQVMHPGLTMIFAGSRKLANQWAIRFFSAVRSHYDDKPDFMIAEALDTYKPVVFTGGSFFVKDHIMEMMAGQFSFAEAKEKFSHVSDSVLRKALAQLSEERRLIVFKTGRINTWHKPDQSTC